MPFDKTTRRETRLLQELYRDGKGRPVYRMLNYAFVEYDGDPDRYLEPLPVLRYGPDERITDAVGDGAGLIVGFEYFVGRPFEVHAFDDVNASNL